MFRLDVGVRVNEGQRWEEQRVETANNPLPGPSVWSYWDLPPLCQVLALSTSQRKQRALQVPSAFTHLHQCPSHLAGPLQNPLRSTPPYGRSLGLHFISPPQSELGPLSCWLSWSSPQPSGPCLPEEEHLESFMAPQMSSGEGVPACPLLLHMPPLLQSSHLPRLLTDQVKSVSCFFRLQLPPNPSASAPLFRSPLQRWHLRLPLSPCA